MLDTDRPQQQPSQQQQQQARHYPRDRESDARVSEAIGSEMSVDFRGSIGLWG